MAAIASIPPFGVATSIEERTFTSVISVSKDNIETVQKTITFWEKTIILIRKELEFNFKADPTSDKTLHDFKLLADCEGILGGVAIQIDEFQKILPETKLLLALDSLKEIQAITCFGSDFEEELVVAELLTAPSNIRWETKLTCLSPPIYGGGTLLMHALFTIAQNTKKPKLGLASTETGKTFYKKLGMATDELGFIFTISDRSHQESIKKALVKSFGTSFRYSLLWQP